MRPYGTSVCGLKLHMHVATQRLTLTDVRAHTLTPIHAIHNMDGTPTDASPCSIFESWKHGVKKIKVSIELRVSNVSAHLCVSVCVCVYA